MRACRIISIRTLLAALLLGSLTNVLLAWFMIRVAEEPGALSSVWLGSVPVESRLSTTFSAYFDDDGPRRGICYIGPVDLLSTAVIVNPDESASAPRLPAWSRWPALDAALEDNVRSVSPDSLTYILEEAVGWPLPSFWRGWVQSAGPTLSTNSNAPHQDTLARADGPSVIFFGTLTQGPSAFAAAWPDEPALMPIRPLWSGFFFNTLIYSVAWFLTIVAAVQLRTFRVRLRRSCGACPVCGYSLTGNTSGICPECGTSPSDAALP